MDKLLFTLNSPIGARSTLSQTRFFYALSCLFSKKRANKKPELGKCCLAPNVVFYLIWGTIKQETTVWLMALKRVKFRASGKVLVGELKCDVAVFWTHAKNNQLRSQRLFEFRKIEMNTTNLQKEFESLMLKIVELNKIDCIRSTALVSKLHLWLQPSLPYTYHSFRTIFRNEVYRKEKSDRPVDSKQTVSKTWVLRMAFWLCEGVVCVTNLFSISIGSNKFLIVVLCISRDFLPTVLKQLSNF